MNISSYGREVKLNTSVHSLWAQTGEDKKKQKRKIKQNLFMKTNYSLTK